MHRANWPIRLILAVTLSKRQIKRLAHEVKAALAQQDRRGQSKHVAKQAARQYAQDRQTKYTPVTGLYATSSYTMKYPNKDYIEHLRRKYPPGTRLQLSCMEDEMAVPPGSMGTVDFIDDAGQIHMNWDCGRSLALIPGVDSFSRLPSPKEKAGDAR